MSGIPERSVKRRFESATGNALTNDLQIPKIEEAERLPESSWLPVDAIGAQAGCADVLLLCRLLTQTAGFPAAIAAPCAGCWRS